TDHGRREQGIRGRAGVVVVHADVVVGRVVHRADGAAQANGAEAACHAAVAVAARQNAVASVQPDPALELEQPRQAAAEVLVAAKAYPGAVVDQVPVTLVRLYRRVAAVLGLDALIAHVGAAVNLDP